MTSDTSWIIQGHSYMMTSIFFLAIVLIFDSPYSLDPGLIFIFMNSCVAGDSHMLTLSDSFHSSEVMFSSGENLFSLFFSIVWLMLEFSSPVCLKAH